MKRTEICMWMLIRVKAGTRTSTPNTTMSLTVSRTCRFRRIFRLNLYHAVIPGIKGCGIHQRISDENGSGEIQRAFSFSVQAMRCVLPACKREYSAGKPGYISDCQVPAGQRRTHSIYGRCTGEICCPGIAA